jgi:hypothetical protein
MIVDQTVFREFVGRVTIKKHASFPGDTQRSPNCPVRLDNILSRLLHVMQIEVDFGEEEPSVKSQRPKDNAVVEFPFEGINRVFKVDVFCINVV